MTKDTSTTIFVCSSDNDLYAVVKATLASGPHRANTAREAVASAPPGSAVAVLADGYPNMTTALSADVWAMAEKKALRLFVEYPAALPEFDVGAPKSNPLLRGVVTSDCFGERLAPMRIVSLNACRYVPVAHDEPLMVLARVAGMDTAVFGLADTPTTPLLFEQPGQRLLVATTQLSNFIEARHMPEDAWRTIWGVILSWLEDGDELTGERRNATHSERNVRRAASSVRSLAWTPSVRPSFERDAPLPDDVEIRAMGRVSDWVVSSHLLRHRDWPIAALAHSEQVKGVSERLVADWPVGDGSLGILEGFTTTIRGDGRQPAMYPVRADCCCETAMLMACNSRVNRREQHAGIAANLLDYVCTTSGLTTGNERTHPEAPGHGLWGWNLGCPDHFWGDDNARAVLSCITTAALLGENRWDDAIARAILGNFRTTGPRGHRPHLIKNANLVRDGWQHYWRLDKLENTAHMTAWLWPCFLWAYRQTGFVPFLERTKAGARALMEAYPQWDYVNGSGPLELARALLPLAWLVRTEDTPEHRGWLRRIAEDLIALQDGASGAIRETVRIGDGTYKNCIATSNAAYGTCETNLIQIDGEPVSDSLYTCNFALIGLHEAAAATGDARYAQAEDALASFLCRIQLCSKKYPELNGAWYRAFNFGNWDFWACCSDGDWGPWCVQTGWTQPWIGITLGLRHLKTSLWDMATGHTVSRAFESIRRVMLPDDALEPAKAQQF